MTDALNALVGTWTVEATHPMIEGVAHGRTTFEWLEGEKFLIQRSQTGLPDIPDSISILGAPDGGELAMFYFDSRGVHRVYRMALDGRAWMLSRDHPGFSQRFTGRIADDMIAGVWELSRDGQTWDDDLAVTYRRLSPGST
jgi:hypothetical protein